MTLCCHSRASGNPQTPVSLLGMDSCFRRNGNLVDTRTFSCSSRADPETSGKHGGMALTPGTKHWIVLSVPKPGAHGLRHALVTSGLHRSPEVARGSPKATPTLAADSPWRAIAWPQAALKGGFICGQLRDSSRFQYSLFRLPPHRPDSWGQCLRVCPWR